MGETAIHDLAMDGSPPDRKPLVRAENLYKEFRGPRPFLRGDGGRIRAIDDVSLAIFPNETLALVGESGCGKTTLGKLLLRILPPNSGTVFFQDKNLSVLPERKLRPWRSKMQLVFQNPANALNPRRTIFQTLREAVRLGGSAQGDSEREIGVLLEQVGLFMAVLHRYPHTLSGGQKQRVAIARALAVRPEFIVCDEAVSALDASVKRQILELLQAVQHEYGISYLFITHDLLDARHIADRIAVMHQGRVVEVGPADSLWQAPRHPYTKTLLSSVPRLRNREHDEFAPSGISRAGESRTVKTEGCGFAATCPHVAEICRQIRPRLQIFDGTEVACHAAVD